MSNPMTEAIRLFFRPFYLFMKVWFYPIYSSFAFFLTTSRVPKSISFSFSSTVPKQVSPCYIGNRYIFFSTYQAFSHYSHPCLLKLMRARFIALAVFASPFLHIGSFSHFPQEYDFVPSSWALTFICLQNLCFITSRFLHRLCQRTILLLLQVYTTTVGKWHLTLVDNLWTKDFSYGEKIF